MRSSIATALTVVLGCVGLLAAPGAQAAPPPPPATTESPAAPQVALSTARRVLSGDALTADPSATVALRDLWMTRHRLGGAERRTAEAILARPSDGVQDPFGFGYDSPELAEKLCNSRLCVHYVPTGDDAPPGKPWVRDTLQVLDTAWTVQVDELGFRPPLRDQGRGGSSHFDVYLKDLGGELYGFCATEQEGRARTASGFCVLDNNYSRTKFPRRTPRGNMRVTAVHEFFHAVQYAYDYTEDPWMMESTATWMEERVASEVNDNRQFLNASQLYQPRQPLDLFVQGRGTQYGNWIFWEYLGTRFGQSIVRKAWERAGSRSTDGRRYSFQALHDVLTGRGGFTRVYAQYVADNLVPEQTYPDGAHYRAPRPRRTTELTRTQPVRAHTTRLAHASSTTYRFTPHRGLARKGWRLRVRVDAPHRRTAPAARVVVHLRNGRSNSKVVRLNEQGQGRRWVAFDSRRVAAVSVSLVNASTRMRCNRQTLLACGGKALDDDGRFRVIARARR